MPEKNLLNIKCVFWFSLQLLSETFLILRRIQRDTIKMYMGLHVKYPLFLSNFNETSIFSTDFLKIFTSVIWWKFIQWEPSCSIQTDRHEKAFFNFATCLIIKFLLQRGRDSSTLIPGGTQSFNSTSCGMWKEQVQKCWN